jgi:hypothetical protein
MQLFGLRKTPELSHALLQAMAFGRNGLSSSNGRLVRTARSHILANFLHTRAQGMPGDQLTRSLVRKSSKHTSKYTTGLAETFRHSLREWF